MIRGSGRTNEVVVGSQAAPQIPAADLCMFCPGPVMTSPGVRAAASGADYCHRDREFERVLASARSRLLLLADAPGYEALLLAGSGTSAAEAVFSTFLPADEMLLVVSNGAFGERLAEIAKVLGIPCRHLRYEWGRAVTGDDIGHALAEDPAITSVAVVHHETSVGRLNPVEEIGQVVEAHGRRYIIDAISSLGAERLSARRAHADVVISTPNKCIHGISGLAFVLVDPGMWESDKAVSPRSMYLDLRRYREQVCGPQTPFTPAVQAVLALDQALEELESEGGPSTRRDAYVRLRDRIEASLPALGMRCHHATASPSSSTLAVRVPDDWTAVGLRDALRDCGYLLYLCRGDFAASHLLLSVMGSLQDQDVDGLLSALASVLGDRSRP